MKRRDLLSGVFAIFGAIALAPTAEAEPRPRRVARWPRRRRYYRRRFRRFAFTRVVFGRPFWVVPVGMMVGWELMHRNRVVVVKETRIVEKDGQKTEVAVIQDSTGKAEQVEILREDNVENADELEGSVVPDDDTSTPTVPAKEAE
jgi:hypothetical protein